MRKFFAHFSARRQGSSDTGVREDSLEDRLSPSSGELDDFLAQTSPALIHTWTPEFASDPDAWEQKFLKHWKVLQNHLSNQNYDKRLLGQVIQN